MLASPALAAPVPLDLPPGRLGEMVARLGRATGASIAVDDPALWARAVPPLRGRMTTRAALDRLARSAGAELRTVGPDAWRLVVRPLPAKDAPLTTPRRVAPAEAMTLTDDIVVTASKRDVRLRDLAGQAAILNGGDLAFGGAGGTDSILSRLASVSSTHLGAGRNKLFIRGIADSSFTGPTQSTVGQYLGDLRLTYNAPDPDLRLYDIASVEVLEGPQGTLYGAGSLGGIIRVSPRTPQLGRIAGSLATGGSLTAHGDPGADLSAMLNLPLLADRAALRLVGYGVSEGGYIDNPVRGKKDINRTHILGGRAGMRVDGGGGWTIDIGAIGQRVRGEDSQNADRDGGRLTRASAIDQGFAASYALGQIVVSKDWDGLHFRSSAGVVGQRLSERYDAGVAAGLVVPGTGPIASPEAAGAVLSRGEARVFAQRNRTRLLASESRLWRPMADGWGWVIGTSITRNRTRLVRGIGLDGASLPATGVVNRIAEYTLYGEASMEPLPGLTITGGGRASHARLSGAAEDVVAPVSAARAMMTADRTVTSLLPSGSITAAILPRLNLFTRYQQGFRPGGLAIEGDFVRRFKGDRVATLESGFRLGQSGRDPVDLTLSISHTRWSDIQADYIDAAGLPSTANIGDGRIWTGSLAGGWIPAPGLRFDLSFTYNDSRVDEPSVLALARAALRMSRVPNVARYAGRIGVDYHRSLGDRVTLRINGWARYVGRSRLGIGPVLGEAQGDYLDTSLTVRVGPPAWGVTLGATNLTDEVGNRFALGTPFAIPRGQITPLRPRTIRIGLDAGF